MNTTDDMASFKTPTLSLDTLRTNVPAVFADRADARTTERYKFIRTDEVVSALLDVGFRATGARQSGRRAVTVTDSARHLITFQHERHNQTLVDAVPQICLINSHDATTAYQLRAGLYRPVCQNGLMVRVADFGFIHVPHRHNVVADIVNGALTMVQQFSDVGVVVEQMAATLLTPLQRIDFAMQALRVRYPHDVTPSIVAQDLLNQRRPRDEGNSLWITYNVIQENLLRGGLVGVTATGRRTQTRGINAIREDVRINTQLWHTAMQLIRA